MKKNFLGKIFRFIWLLIKGLMQWLFVDLFRNVRLAVKYARNPAEESKVNRELDAQKKLEVHDERIERVERLVYGVYNDTEYSKSAKGQHDLKILKERVR